MPASPSFATRFFVSAKPPKVLVMMGSRNGVWGDKGLGLSRTRVSRVKVWCYPQLHSKPSRAFGPRKKVGVRVKVVTALNREPPALGPLDISTSMCLLPC